MEFIPCIYHLHTIPCGSLPQSRKADPWGSERQVYLPLKLGLILASYPEVLPISLSRKSEGDIGLDAERAASASLEAARLRKERESRGLMTALSHTVIRSQSCSAPVAYPAIRATREIGDRSP